MPNTKCKLTPLFDVNKPKVKSRDASNITYKTRAKHQIYKSSVHLSSTRMKTEHNRDFLLTLIAPFVQRAQTVNRWFSKYYNIFGKKFQDLNLSPLNNFIARKQSEIRRKSIQLKL